MSFSQAHLRNVAFQVDHETYRKIETAAKLGGFPTVRQFAKAVVITEAMSLREPAAAAVVTDTGIRRTD